MGKSVISVNLTVALFVGATSGLSIPETAERISRELELKEACFKALMWMCCNSRRPNSKPNQTRIRQDSLK